MINLKALPSTFQVESIKTREQKATQRQWQACFYSVRQLIWDSCKGRIFKDAIEKVVLEPIAPPIRLKDGSYSKPEFDPNDIKQLYSEAWREFTASFDAAFIHATTEELVKYAEEHFGMGLSDLLELNNQRSALKHNR
ncbi:MAG: hypothetical protein Q6M54_05765 [Thermostichus sp. DRC_bins_24]